MRREIIAEWARQMVEILTNTPDEKIGFEIEKLKERISNGTLAEVQRH